MDFLKKNNIIKQTLSLVLWCLAGVAVMFFLNYLVEQTVIPDPCYYHTRDTTALFDVFYKIESSEGYHPVATMFNLLLTMGLGIVLGCYSWRKTTKR